MVWPVAASHTFAELLAVTGERPRRAGARNQPPAIGRPGHRPDGRPGRVGPTDARSWPPRLARCRRGRPRRLSCRRATRPRAPRRRCARYRSPGRRRPAHPRRGPSYPGCRPRYLPSGDQASPFDNGGLPPRLHGRARRGVQQGDRAARCRRPRPGAVGRPGDGKGEAFDGVFQRSAPAGRAPDLGGAIVAAGGKPLPSGDQATPTTGPLWPV